jgi:hypothetical protein
MSSAASWAGSQKRTPSNRIWGRAPVIPNPPPERRRTLRPRTSARLPTPTESKHPWDYYRLVETMPGDQAFGKLSDSTRPLLKE